MGGALVAARRGERGRGFGHFGDALPPARVRSVRNVGDAQGVCRTRPPRAAAAKRGPGAAGHTRGPGVRRSGGSGPRGGSHRAAGTSAAAEAVSKGELDAAIASSTAAEHFGLEIRAEDIGDNSGAVTRFICAQKPGWIPDPTGDDRTSMAVFIDIDHAGALLEILQVFAKNDVNLTFIQSRPTGRELGHYHFIIDVEGHINDSPVGKSVEELREICDDIRFLGSYPREVRS